MIQYNEKELNDIILYFDSHKKEYIDTLAIVFNNDVNKLNTLIQKHRPDKEVLKNQNHNQNHNHSYKSNKFTSPYLNLNPNSYQHVNNRDTKKHIPQQRSRGVYNQYSKSGYSKQKSTTSHDGWKQIHSNKKTAFHKKKEESSFKMNSRNKDKEIHEYSNIELIQKCKSCLNKLTEMNKFKLFGSIKEFFHEILKREKDKKNNDDYKLHDVYDDNGEISNNLMFQFFKTLFSFASNNLFLKSTYLELFQNELFDKDYVKDTTLNIHIEKVCYEYVLYENTRSIDILKNEMNTLNELSEEKQEDYDFLCSFNKRMNEIMNYILFVFYLTIMCDTEIENLVRELTTMLLEGINKTNVSKMTNALCNVLCNIYVFFQEKHEKDAKNKKQTIQPQYMKCLTKCFQDIQDNYHLKEYKKLHPSLTRKMVFQIMEFDV